MVYILELGLWVVGYSRMRRGKYIGKQWVNYKIGKY